MSMDSREAVGQPPYPTAATAWIMVGVLAVANIFSFIDRQIVSLLVDPIKATIHVTDVQISLLIGPAFALFFAAMALPIGRIVDTRNRLRLAAAGVALWSLMTLSSGFASTFLVLFLARIGVGVGEAVMFPAANSLISDSFAQESRARPIGVYAMAIYLGSGLAFLFGGAIVGLVEHGRAGGLLPDVLAGFATWQIVMIGVGAPGFVVAAALLLLPEPKRKDLLLSTHGDNTVPIGAVVAYMRARAALFTYQAVCFAAFAVVGYSVMSWVPTHLTRSLGMARAEAGLWFGVTVMAAGVAGIAGATALADRLARAGIVDGKFRIGAALCLGGAAFAFASIWAATPITFILMMGGIILCASAGIGVGPSALQQVTPNEMRGQAFGAYQLIATVLGAGLGPPSVALISEKILHDPKSVGLAISIVTTIVFVAGAAGFAAGRRTFGRGVAETLAKSFAA